MVKESTGQVILREILIIQIGASPMELRSTDRYNYQAIPFEASQHEVSTNNQQKTISDSQPHQFRTNLWQKNKPPFWDAVYYTLSITNSKPPTTKKHQPASSKWLFFDRLNGGHVLPLKKTFFKPSQKGHLSEPGTNEKDHQAIDLQNSLYQHPWRIHVWYINIYIYYIL